MLSQNAAMRDAQSLVCALEGVKVTPPKVLQHIVDGFDLLGPAIQPASEDPANVIVAAAAEGKLTSKSLDELLSKAAAESATSGYRQEFRLKAERKFVRQFHAALVDGAADEILDALRPHFDTIAAELTTAHDAVDLQATPARLLDVTATAKEQEAWRTLPELIRQIDRIGTIAAAFGPHADLAVIDDLTNADSLLRLGWLDDRVLMCTDGNVVTACTAFRQPNPHWQTSPWLRVDLKLATIAEAQERYREVAESDWAAREHHFDGSGTFTKAGFVQTTHTNPHAIREPAEATA